MIDFLFLTLPNPLNYNSFMKPITFSQQLQSFSCWAFKQPLTIYSKDLKQKHVFINERVQIQKISTALLEQKWKYFVITRSNNSKIYCTSYIFYQKSYVQMQKNSFFQINGPYYVQTQFYVPKCLIIKSDKPYFKLQTNLVKIYRELRKDNASFARQSLQNLDSSMKRQYISTDIKLKLRSSFIGSNKKSKQLLNKNQDRNNVDNLFGYYVWAANQQLIKDKIYRCPRTGLEILHIYNIGDSLYRLNYFFHLPISMDNLGTILSAILQEKQIIFTSNNQNSNLMLMETLLQMLRPLKWQYMYVPNLPESMLDAAQHSFMPYMVGIHRKYLNKITTTGRVVVYVDTDQIKTEEQIHPLPLVLKNMLLYAQQKFADLKYLEWQSQVRIRSILVISTLLIQFPIVQLKHRQNKDYKFYSFFFQKSAMYSTFKQQMFKQANIQIAYIFWVPFQVKIKILQQKFKKMLIQASQPIICQNDKEWVKYYLANPDQNKKSLKRSNISSWSRSSISQNWMRASILASTASIKQQIKNSQSINYKKKIGFISSTVKF